MTLKSAVFVSKATFAKRWLAGERMAVLGATVTPIPRLDAIIRDVARAFGVEATKLRSSDRARSITRARAVAMYVARVRLGMTYPELGRAFGQADHTSAMSAVHAVERRIRADVDLKRSVDQLAGRSAA